MAATSTSQDSSTLQAPVSSQLSDFRPPSCSQPTNFRPKSKSVPFTNRLESILEASSDILISDSSGRPAGSSLIQDSNASHNSRQSHNMSAPTTETYGAHSFPSTAEQDAVVPYDMHPFLDPTQKIGPTPFAVLKIKNVSLAFPLYHSASKVTSLQIPYDVTRQEIIHFLGREPNIILNHLMGCAVHIIMERPTSKTMDCFVEFQTAESVVEQIRRHDDMIEYGRHPKLGSRHVQVENVNQDALLKEIFPRAKSLAWRNGNPEVLENQDPYSTGFRGFFTNEEMVGLVRHAESPQRVS